MKKFTKICLTTALVLFLVGIILCLACGFLGGFRQLDRMDGIGILNGNAGDWRIGFFRSVGYDGDGLDDIDNIEDIEDVEEVRKSVNHTVERKLKELEGEREQLALTAESLESLEIDVEQCNVVILNSDDASAWLLIDGHKSNPRYKIEQEDDRNTLFIESDKHHAEHWNWKGENRDTVYLWLPQDCTLKTCLIDVGAGYLTSISLKAEWANISIGAGLLEIDGFEGEEITFLVGAGELLAGKVTAQKADFEIGAGHLNVAELAVSREADVTLSMGNCEIAGTITGDLDLECDMGEAALFLTGSEDDHSYDVECGMGTVNVGSFEHGGFATERSWNSGKDSQFDVECNMGTVTINFEK